MLSMTTGYVYDVIYLLHDLPGHPENSERLRTIMAQLERSGLLPALTPIPAQTVDLDLLRAVHPEVYRAQIERVSLAGGGFLDYDTYIARRSYEAALKAAGGVVEATAAVLDGRVRNAFALVRPPGHHALRERGMGFCLFNNVALAARYALGRSDIQRVLIVDFDVHHGNGTQDIFFHDREVLYFSTHEYPFYPGTGHWREIGAGEGEGFTVNVPLMYGTGDSGIKAAFDELLWPIARRYGPDLILVSAGYDAHWSDPLAGLCLSLAGYAEICRRLLNMAEELCDGRLVFALEGGYQLGVLAQGVANTFRILLGQPERRIDDAYGLCPEEEPPMGDLLARLRACHHVG